MIKRRLLPSILVLLLAAPAARAQAGLAEALTEAWSRHPAALAAPDRTEAARASAALAGAPTPAPATVALAGLTDAIDRDRGRREWELELAVPLWLPGQRAARAGEAEAIAAEVEASLGLARLELAGTLRAAWWRLAGARAARELASRRLDDARALEADVERRHRAGELARTDANLAAEERLAAETGLIDADAAQADAEQDWRTLVGQPAPVLLAAEPVPGATPDTDHPRLVARAAAARLAHARIRIAAESRRDAPELALRAERERGARDEAYGHAIGLRLALPLRDHTRPRRDQAEARADAATADAELARARLELAGEQTRARRALEVAERGIALTRARLVRLDDNLRLAEKAFALGETDLASLLRSRALAREAEAAGARASIARDAAVSALAQSLGVLP